MEPLAAIREAYARCRDREAGYARSAITWWVEEDDLAAEQAEQAAAAALEAAERHDLVKALRLARRACQWEASEFGDCPCWRPFREAIARALADNGERSTSHAVA
jgi:hypothetical protein